MIRLAYLWSIVAISIFVLASSAGAAAQSPAPPAAAPVQSSPTMVELAKALAWPLSAGLIALLFRNKQGSRFLVGIALIIASVWWKPRRMTRAGTSPAGDARGVWA